MSIYKPTPAELQKILADHKLWLRGEDGSRADLSGADLRSADLSGADLRSAVLSGADLRSAVLSGAVLRSAVLRSAVLSGADLRSADLRSAVLSGAVLRSAVLSGADLRSADLRSAVLRSAVLRSAVLSGADLSGADLRSADLPAYQIPQEGELIVWKKVKGATIKLRIPPEARRTATPLGRKCRAEFVEVLEGEGRGLHDTSFYYKAGDIVRPDKYDDDFRVECTHGIHFFLTKEEADAYGY